VTELLEVGVTELRSTPEYRLITFVNHRDVADRLAHEIGECTVIDHHGRFWLVPNERTMHELAQCFTVYELTLDTVTA
jgi:hypothetical protein